MFHSFLFSERRPFLKSDNKRYPEPIWILMFMFIFSLSLSFFAHAKAYELTLRYVPESDDVIIEKNLELSSLFESEEYIPGYREETSLCFKNKSGRDVFYRIPSPSFLAGDRGLFESFYIRVRDSTGILLFDGPFSVIDLIGKRIPDKKEAELYLELYIPAEAGNEIMDKSCAFGVKLWLSDSIAGLSDETLDDIEDGGKGEQGDDENPDGNEEDDGQGGSGGDASGDDGDKDDSNGGTASGEPDKDDGSQEGDGSGGGSADDDEDASGQGDGDNDDGGSSGDGSDLGDDKDDGTDGSNEGMGGNSGSSGDGGSGSGTGSGGSGSSGGSGGSGSAGGSSFGGGGSFVDGFGYNTDSNALSSSDKLILCEAPDFSRTQGYTGGSWVLLDKDRSLWGYKLSSGEFIKSGFALLFNPYSKDEGSFAWYYFDKNGYMGYSWIKTEGDKWYFGHDSSDGDLGSIRTGWHYDSADKRTYYLSPDNGLMHTGWLTLTENGRENSYFFARIDDTYKQNWFYNTGLGRWIYDMLGDRTYGSMYRDEMTPDGRYVDKDGRLTEKT